MLAILDKKSENNSVNENSKIYVAGHMGMVGSAVVRRLNSGGYGGKVLTATKSEVDLTNQEAVIKLIERLKPDAIVNCAAKVGGIHANNTYRAQFIYENLQIQNNLTHAAHIHGVSKLLFLGSSCIYPKFADQPIREESLLSSELEKTNEPYAIAKIAGVKMCEAYFSQYGSNFLSVMPCNQYGPNDNFHPLNSHVLPALIKRFHDAKIDKDKVVRVWGTGRAKREFMFVDDLADACFFILLHVEAKDIYNQNISHLNVGTGTDVTISALANIIAGVVGYDGEIEFDSTKPDGTLRKLMDSSKLKNLGWENKTSLHDGLSKTYDWYKKQVNVKQV